MGSVGKLILLLFLCSLTINSLQHLPFSILCTHGLQLLGSPHYHNLLCLIKLFSSIPQGFTSLRFSKESSFERNFLLVLPFSFRNQSCKNYVGTGLHHVDIKWRVVLCLIQVNSKKK
jgi:hypothetical protein